VTSIASNAGPPPPSICMSVDYDGVSTWIAAGATGLRSLSRGEFGAVSTPQLLDIFQHYGITTTWFIPGTTALQFPESVASVAAHGHEIANHGLRHEDAASLPIDEMRASFVRANDILEQVTGRRPTGIRVAGGDLGDGTCMRVLAEEGFLYDSSLLGGYDAFWAPSPHTIDADGLVHRDAPLPLVELPFAWSLTDFSHFEFNFGPPQYRALLPNPRHLEEMWRDEIDDLTTRNPHGFLMMTLHPQVIGRGSRLAMLERVIEHAMARGLRFTTANTLAQEFRAAAEPAMPYPSARVQIRDGTRP
jgi:peptidoglycan-N-acetylglucosamine deacetylase